MVATRCGRVVAVRLEGLQETVDSLTGTGYRASHRAGVSRGRTPVQPPVEMPVETAGSGSTLKEARSQKDRGRRNLQPS
jgi:hypothetical protein